MKDIPMKNLVAMPAYCVALKKFLFPQNTVLVWWNTDIVLAGQKDPIQNLYLRADLTPQMQEQPERIVSAPTAEELARRAPSNYYTIVTKGGFFFCDGQQIQVNIMKGPKGDVKQVVHKKINEADARTEADCWAMGLLHLCMANNTNFEKKEVEPIVNPKKV